MAGVQARAFDSPDETRAPDKTRVEVVRLGDVTAARLTLQPGWRWSECIKPVAGTDSCQLRHVGVVHSGRMHVIHDDGLDVTNANSGAATTGALRVRNSWGTGWGDHGYGALPYKYVTDRLAVDFWSLVKEGWTDTGPFKQ